ncbi:MAG TPA: hypothetical protein VL979_12685 [Solirubrobacteraceae bacterium]|nr:hypothetical protein [Solirubrobacteraceae bacterium]
MYGFALAFDRPERDIASRLTPAPATWPLLTVRRRVDELLQPARAGLSDGELQMGEDVATVELPEGTATMRREQREASFATAWELGADELVHPMLGHVALAFAHWLGRESFHAGVFLAGGRAWGLLGARGAGKSSTLAWLARRGQAIVADDLLFLDGRTAFVGPRTIDLAAESAAHLDAQEPLEQVRGGLRLRLRLGELAPEHPFAGWISLAWEERLAIAPVPAPARIPLLIEHGHQPRGEANWQRVLELAQLPTFELRRPRRLESLEEAGELLLSTIATAG